MGESAATRGGDAGKIVYVYGIVPGDGPPAVFDGVSGIDASEPVVLVHAAGFAAVASRVPADEFGADAIESRLHDPRWLEQKARAHEAVLESALGKTTVLPFRFGTLYADEAHVREMLAGHPEFAETLSRLEGKVELGVKGFLDRDAFRKHLDAQRRGAADAPESGRAYMQRKQLERELDEAARAFAVECAEISHQQLTVAAEAGRMNAAQPFAVTQPNQEMLLNGAYLLRSDDEQRFADALAALRERYAAEGVTYKLTGPWPPYNFVGESDE